VGSVTLGRGQPLLPRRIASPPLRLISVTAFGTGLVELRYTVPRPAGTGLTRPTAPMPVSGTRNDG
jgi:hypothetical protein